VSGSEDSTRLRETAGFRNLRDLGGLPVAGGGSIRPGLVYRSEAPTGLDGEQLEELRELGLKSAIDLRHQAGEDLFITSTLPETVQRLDAGILPPADPSGKGLLQQVMDGELNEYSAAQLGEMYVDFLDTRAPAFGRAVGYIADPDNLPTLIHCHAGKDRTGIVVAILLELVGVPRPLIIDDYELTTSCRAYRRAEVEGTLRDLGTEWDRVAPLFTAPRESLEIALDHLVHEFGSVREYLLGPGGISEETPDRLADCLVIR
jgi:protein-tyrosine phosphatase